MSILEFSMLVIFSVHLAEWCIKPVDTTFFFIIKTDSQVNRHIFSAAADLAPFSHMLKCSKVQYLYYKNIKVKLQI